MANISKSKPVWKVLNNQVQPRSIFTPVHKYFSSTYYRYIVIDILVKGSKTVDLIHLNRANAHPLTPKISLENDLLRINLIQSTSSMHIFSKMTTVCIHDLFITANIPIFCASDFTAA